MRKIKELQKVKLKKDIPKCKLRRGQEGIVAFVDKNEIEMLVKEKEAARMIAVPINFVGLR